MTVKNRPRNNQWFRVKLLYFVNLNFERSQQNWADLFLRHLFPRRRGLLEVEGRGFLHVQHSFLLQESAIQIQRLRVVGLPHFALFRLLDSRQKANVFHEDEVRDQLVLLVPRFEVGLLLFWPRHDHILLQQEPCLNNLLTPRPAV